MTDPGDSTNPASPIEPPVRAAPAPAPIRPRCWWRRFKWTLRILILVPLLLLASALVLMRSAMVGRMVAEQVHTLTGGQLTATKTLVTLNGQLLISDLRLRAPGIDGPAGQLLAADEAIADIDWLQVPPLRWFGGSTSASARPVVSVIRLTRPVIRVSQSMDDETINLTALKPGGGTGASAAVDLPRVDIIEGRIEFAEHSPRRELYDALNVLPISGSLLPAGGGRAAFNVRLQEIGRVPIAVPPAQPDAPAPRESADRNAMILDGFMDLSAERGSLKVYYVSFDAWPAEAVPARYRALWRQLGLQGQVTEASFDYSPETRLSLSVKVAGVAIVVPVPASRAGDEDSYLALRGVTGDIGLTTAGLTADLTGVMTGQTEPAHVELTTRGLDFTSGFRCQITGRRINVASDAGLQSYVPEIARQYLDWFGGPTAEVDTRVVIERGDPIDGKAAPISVPDGQLKFRRGSAAFHTFPYRFHDMGGEVRFDDQTIRIIEITGTGSSGSPLRASGTITPISENAQVDLRIDVDQVPVNDDLLAAMQPVHRRLMEVLFSRPQHERLLAKGLVREPDAPGDAPEFMLGGSADVRIRVLRPPGESVDWSTNVDVAFSRAGLVPEPFPFPIVGSDLRLRITDDDAVFKSGHFTGLRGGDAVVEASVVFADGAGLSPEPDVRIEATDIPIDALLLSALPGDDTSDGLTDETELDARAVLNRLDLRGSVDCRVAISSPSKQSTPAAPSDDFVGPIDEPPVDYTVVVELDRVTAAPRATIGPVSRSAAPASSRLCIRELSGDVVVTDDGVSIPELRAHLGRLTSAAPDSAQGGSPDFEQAESAGSMVIRMEAQTLLPGEGELGGVHAEVELAELELTDPVEHLVAVFAASPAAFVEQVRRERSPTGRINATVSIDAPRGPSTRDVTIGVAFHDAEQLTARAFGGEVAVHQPAGSVFVTRSGEPSIRGDRVRFEQLRGNIAYNGTQSGAFELRGGFAIGESPRVLQGPADLTCTVNGWEFEGGLTEALIQRFAGERAGEAYRSVTPRGRFDASVSAAAAAGEPAISGWIAPTSLSLTRRGEVIAFDKVTGRATFEADAGAITAMTTLDSSAAADQPRVRGRIEDAHLVSASWTIGGDARWHLRPRGPAVPAAVIIKSSLDAEVWTIDDALRALLPTSVAEALTGAEIRFDDPLRVHADALDVILPIDDPEQADVLLSGHVDFARLSAEAGVPIRDAHGRVSIEARSAGKTGSTDEPATLLKLDASSLRLAGVELTRLTADAVQAAPGELRIASAAADCHGGRVFADVSAYWPVSDTAPTSEKQPISFRLNTLMSGVNFAPLLDDLSRTDGTIAASTPTDLNNASPSSDAARGLVDARLSLEGVAGDIRSRHGRGAIRIAHGDVLRLPVVLPLMQVSNLMLPSRDRLNYLQSTFYIDGPTAHFDDIRVDSRSVSIVGSGRLTLPEMSLDMRFNTRSNQRVPLWSDLFEALRNEIASTTVTGTVEKPIIRSETLSTTRRIIGDIVRPGDIGLPRETGERAPLPASGSGESPLEFPRRRTQPAAPTENDRADAAGG